MAFGKDPGWYFRIGPHIWQQSICWSFILISGFVWSWGKKKNLRRGQWRFLEENEVNFLRMGAYE